MTDKELGTAAGDIFAKAFTLGYETGRNYIPAGGMALTAEQAEDVRAARDGLRGYRNFTGYGRSYVNQLIAAVDALFPATEPAAERCDAVSIYGDRCFKTFGHDDDHKVFNYTWDSTYPAPAEPAEEETKAEVHDPDALAKRLAWIWHDGWDACGERERGYLRRAAEMAHSHYASSPVVPAPTETGPWQRIEDVPEGVLQIKDRHGRTWLVVGGTWRFEWHDGNWHEPHTNINAQAPFVAAAEEG